MYVKWTRTRRVHIPFHVPHYDPPPRWSVAARDVAARALGARLHTQTLGLADERCRTPSLAPRAFKSTRHRAPSPRAAVARVAASAPRRAKTAKRCVPSERHRARGEIVDVDARATRVETGRDANAREENSLARVATRAKIGRRWRRRARED